MSEDAYWAQHRADYGVFPDEDGQQESPSVIYCAHCGKPCDPDDCNSDDVCVKCGESK